MPQLPNVVSRGPLGLSLKITPTKSLIRGRPPTSIAGALEPHSSSPATNMSGMNRTVADRVLVPDAVSDGLRLFHVVSDELTVDKTW